MWRAVTLTVWALAFAGCARGARSDVQSALDPNVYVITAESMIAWCNMVGPDGKPMDPEGMCQDFRTPPADAVARFEQRLPGLLVAKGRSQVAARLGDYVRQYWGVFEHGRLDVVFNFVCRSELQEWHIFPDKESEPMTAEEMAHIPITIDDAGTCNIVGSFPADRPEDAEFVASGIARVRPVRDGTELVAFPRVGNPVGG